MPVYQQVWQWQIVHYEENREDTSQDRKILRLQEQKSLTTASRICYHTSMNPCPCKDCKDRVVGCHSGCGKYAEFLVTDKAIKDAMKEQKKDENAYIRRVIKHLGR